jgi:hypothetical protein
MLGAQPLSLMNFLGDRMGQGGRPNFGGFVIPENVTRTRPGFVSSSEHVLGGLAAQLHRYQSGDHTDTAGHIHDDDAAWAAYVADEQVKYQTYRRVISEASVCLGHKISSRALASFDEMVCRGQEPSVGLLLSLDGIDHLDQRVYESYMLWLRASEDGHPKLENMDDGTLQLQHRSDQLGGHDQQPLELRRQNHAEREENRRRQGTMGGT